jgi:hypothetical protein
MATARTVDVGGDGKDGRFSSSLDSARALAFFLAGGGAGGYVRVCAWRTKGCED